MKLTTPVLIAIVVGAILLIVALGAVGLIVWMRQRINKHLTGLKQRYPERDVILMAPTCTLVGMQRPSESRVLRGNGTLIVTSKELILSLWLPKGEIIIPRAAIREVGETDAFAGKSLMRPLLLIKCMAENGEAVSLALLVPELERWKSTLNRR